MLEHHRAGPDLADRIGDALARVSGAEPCTGSKLFALLAAIIPACQAVLSAWRDAGGLVVHTREAHKADLSDCPPAKRNRGNPSLRIGDPGPMGRVLVMGEPGNQIIDELAPLPGEIVIDKPGKGAFYATGLHDLLHQVGITHLVFMGVTTEVCVQTSMREANDRGYDACCWRTAPRVTFRASRPAPSR